MKVFQTFWSGNKNPLTNSWGWLNPESNIMSWALSCMFLKEHYNEVVLYTDSAVCKKYVVPMVFVDGHKLPEDYSIEDIIRFGN